MDDLDHSMCIADLDWSSFYEEAERCCSLQPGLARADDWSLSDSEDSGGLSVSLSTSRPQLTGCWPDDGRFGPSGSEAEGETRCDATAPRPEGAHTSAAGRALQVTSVPVQREQRNGPSPGGGAAELKTGDREAGASSLPEPDPLSCKQRELSAGAETERWFITVSDGPARQRPRTKAQKTQKTRTRPRKTRKGKTRPSWSRKRARASGGEDQQFDGISAGRPGSGGHPAVDRQNPSGSSLRAQVSGPDSETGDSVEFVSAHSWDSDSFLSAEEDCGGPPPSSPPLGRKHTSESTVCPGCDTGSRHWAAPPPRAARPSDKTATECDAVEAGGAPARGSVGHAEAAVTPATPVTPAPCTAAAADSPESYAAKAGHQRPVYAISAFWAEMEKLTINDILQLRAGRATPPAGTDGLAAPRSSAVQPASDGALMDGSDAADSDYFTQPDDSKPDRSSCEFSASDLEEEEYWQFLGTSRNPSPDPPAHKIQGLPRAWREEEQEEESAASEGADTPVPPEGSASGSSEDQEALTPNPPAGSRPILKSKSVRNIQALNTLDVRPDCRDESSLFLCSCLSVAAEELLGPGDRLETPEPLPFPPGTTTQISFHEAPECYYEGEAAGAGCSSVVVYSPEDFSLGPTLDHSFLDTLCASRSSKEKPVPIFSCSHPTVREPTFPSNPFLSAGPPGGTVFPFTVEGDSRDPGRGSSAAPEWFHTWNGLLPTWRIRFNDKGCIFWKESGSRFVPVEDRKSCTHKADQPVALPDLQSVFGGHPQTRRDPAVQQRTPDAIQIRQDHLLSTLRQSDMCLVCIAFASWVLRSSDPDAADAWKAALLANVSALSAIQYLRRYVRRKPSQNNP